MNLFEWATVDTLDIGDYVLVFYRTDQEILSHKLQKSPNEIWLDDYPRFYHFGIVTEICKGKITVKLCKQTTIDFYFNFISDSNGECEIEPIDSLLKIPDNSLTAPTVDEVLKIISDNFVNFSNIFFQARDELHQAELGISTNLKPGFRDHFRKSNGERLVEIQKHIEKCLKEFNEEILENFVHLSDLKSGENIK